MLDECLFEPGGMMPLPYSKLTACMTRFNGHSLLIDCGREHRQELKRGAGVLNHEMRSVLHIFMQIISVDFQDFF